MPKPNLINYGQHFLVSQSIKKLFLKLCNLTGKEQVLEIGPGEGALSRELIQKAKAVTAIEIDKSLEDKLSKMAKGAKNFNVHYQNILSWNKFDYDLVCGALSYAIFEPLMVRLITRSEFTRGVFLVSAQVKEAFNKKSGRLFYLLPAFFEVELSDTIAPNEFAPSPRGAGVIVSLKRKVNPDCHTLIWQELWRQGDKKIKNSLKEALIRVTAQSGKMLTQKQAKLQLVELTKNPEADLPLWQVGNDFLHKINQFIVYSKVC